MIDVMMAELSVEYECTCIMYVDESIWVEIPAEARLSRFRHSTESDSGCRFCSSARSFLLRLSPVTSRLMSEMVSRSLLAKTKCERVSTGADILWFSFLFRFYHY